MDITSLIGSAGNGAGASKAARSAQETQDRFLTLLVAQMKNQDPMNPMENAQLTTQIAQIQTVTGVDQLNTSIEKMGQQFGQSQTLAGVALVGRDVTLAGNRLALKDGGAEGSFELSGAADQVEVEITTAAGTVIERLQLGAAGAGPQTFGWPREGLDPATELRFNVKALRGGKPVAATTYSRDTVLALQTQGGALSFQLASGHRAGYSEILTVD